MTISEINIRETPIFPFFISSHSSISVDSISNTFNAIPIPKAKPTAAVIDQPIALAYCIKIVPQSRPGMITPYCISMFFIMFCIKTEESKIPFAKDIASSDLQLAINVLNSPLEIGTATLTVIAEGVYEFDKFICF